MTSRQPLQPLFAHLARPTTTNATAAMDERIHEQEDLQDAASVVSGLSSLENDAEDEFDRQMIQNMRDERRLNQALGGRSQAFKKARIRPRVGLTLDNLERNNAVAGASAHVQFESPPSSSGSTRSDPAIHAPATWGRKSRSNRNWMRTITHEESLQTPAPADDTINGHYDDGDANVPRRSVEDSPLSHKSFNHGTPRKDRSQEWDLTFELNEASMIASTPYIPRNTALDDIRQREIESLKEQAVTTARLGRIREGSPEQTRRRSSSTRTTETAANIAGSSEQATLSSPSPHKRSRTRTQSWQSIGKAQPVTGSGKEDSPVAMYKSAESLTTLEREVAVTTQKIPPKRIPNRREDSQDLLRRLARVSNTPSPKQHIPSRPQTAPPGPLNSSSQTMVTDTEPTQPESKEESREEAPVEDAVAEPAASRSEVQPEQTKSKEESQEAVRQSEKVPETAAKAENVDATPMPKERPVLNPKTPVVTGAWVDTPGPRTILRPTSKERSPSRSPKKSSLRKNKLPEKKRTASAAEEEDALAEEVADTIIAEVTRPKLPRSALQALVEDAKSSSADYGDSTINSLEDLITPSAESPEMDEGEGDTLQGLQLPTGTPKNEAERQRNQELLHLHRMNDRLRAARTSIRDASRGMKRVEDQVEHVDDGEPGSSDKTKIVYTGCPCAVDGHVQNFSMWRWWKSFFWQDRLKTRRQTRNSWWKKLGGLTALSIFLMLFLTYWVTEEIAWYVSPLNTDRRLSVANSTTVRYTATPSTAPPRPTLSAST
jgi:hypothetical protein